MFVRKKKNRSGSVSIVVVDKSRGRFREVRRFGVAHTEAEADALYTQAREWIRRYAGQQTIDFGGVAVASENEVEYHGLWVVEKAFRVSKGNLEIRPIFHFTERRIEAHV